MFSNKLTFEKFRLHISASAEILKRQLDAVYTMINAEILKRQLDAVCTMINDDRDDL